MLNILSYLRKIENLMERQWFTQEVLNGKWKCWKHYRVIFLLVWLRLPHSATLYTQAEAHYMWIRFGGNLICIQWKKRIIGSYLGGGRIRNMRGYFDWKSICSVSNNIWGGNKTTLSINTLISFLHFYWPSIILDLSYLPTL